MDPATQALSAQFITSFLGTASSASIAFFLLWLVMRFYRADIKDLIKDSAVEKREQRTQYLTEMRAQSLDHKEAMLDLARRIAENTKATADQTVATKQNTEATARMEAVLNNSRFK